MAESYTSPTTYESIDEIMARKQLLLKDIQKDAEKIDVQWHSLFKKPEGLKRMRRPRSVSTPSSTRAPVRSTDFS